MKIAYLVHLNMDANTGVFKKIFQQIRIWKSLEQDVKLFIVTRSSQVTSASHDIMNSSEVFLYKRMTERLYKMNEAVDAVLKYAPDVVYYRRDLAYPPIIKLAYNLHIIIEINGYESAELWRQNKVAWLYHTMTRSFLDRNISGLVFVTEELSGLGYYKKLNVAKSVIANGIVLSDFPHLPISKENKPNLLFLGFSYFWSGIDKVIYLAGNFPQWTFHMVGINKQEFPKAPPNMIFYGKIGFQDYLEIAAKSHVGIGMLALHRTNLNEASPLKVREYLALGLPVIIGYKDTDFPVNKPFILQLPNNESNVKENLALIEKFVYDWMERRVGRTEISHLDYNVKEKKRLDFFDKVRRMY